MSPIPHIKMATTMAEEAVDRSEVKTQPPSAARPTFAEIYDSCFAFAWRAARRLGTPEANLDDVVQEIFMVVHRKQEDFEGRSSVKTWLYGIVFNVVRAHRRELWAKHPHALLVEAPDDPDLLPDGGDRPDEEVARREAAAFVDRFLASLDADRRDVFVLAELEQLSAPEIAGVVGVPLNTVYSRLRLARIDFSKAVARHRARDTWRNHV